MNQLGSRSLLHKCLYLDRAYVSELYEVLTGESPKTTITKNQARKAGAAIPVFSAEVSAQETRSYPLSSFAMLASVLKVIEKEPNLQADEFKSGMSSKFGWIEGELTVFRAKATVLRNKTGETETLAEDGYFHLRQKPNIDLALITTPEYFTYGLDAFLRMQETLLNEMSLPVRSFVRVMAARSYASQWIGVPLLILERSDA